MKTSNRTKRFTLLLEIILLAASVMVSLTLALAASAQSTGNGVNIPPEYGLVNSAKKTGLPMGKLTVTNTVATIISIVLGIVGVIAVIIIIYAGLLWLTASGNEEKITKAKTLLTSSVIGLAIILAAYSISAFIINSLREAAIGIQVSGQCNNDLDCGQGNVCVNHICVNNNVQPVKECDAQTPCPDPKICDANGICVDPSSPQPNASNVTACQDHPDCPLNQICILGNCVDCKGEGQACGDDIDCCRSTTAAGGWLICKPQFNNQKICSAP